MSVWNEVSALCRTYLILDAAMLWSGVEESEVGKLKLEVSRADIEGLGRVIYSHPRVDGLEDRCRALVTAIDRGRMFRCKSHANPLNKRMLENVVYWHVEGIDLKSWMKEEFTNERPFFLFGPLGEGESIRSPGQQIDDASMVSTKAHNNYSDVIRVLSECLLDRPLTTSNHTEANAIINAVESKGKVFPVEARTLYKYLKGR